jgi:hypothetical protein
LSAPPKSAPRRDERSRASNGADPEGLIVSPGKSLKDVRLSTRHGPISGAMEDDAGETQSRPTFAVAKLSSSLHTPLSMFN